MRSQPSLSLRQQYGFTLVEALVALAISVILLLGVINIFNAGKQSYILQNGVARLEENARFAFEIMSRSITMAGYEGADDANVLPFADAQTTDGPSDAIAVNFRANAIDCIGNPTTVAAVNTDNFSIAGGGLVCKGNTIVNGIVGMQILYGEDNTTHPGEVPIQRSRGIADHYLPYGSTTLRDDMSEDGGITSVRIALLVRTISDANAITDTPDDSVYSLLDGPAYGPYSDFQTRRIFTRTIILRNYVNRPKHPVY